MSQTELKKSNGTKNDKSSLNDIEQQLKQLSNRLEKHNSKGSLIDQNIVSLRNDLSSLQEELDPAGAQELEFKKFESLSLE